MTRNIRCQNRATVVKSTSRKFALFLRGKGERKAHTYDMGCYRQLGCSATFPINPLSGHVAAAVTMEDCNIGIALELSAERFRVHAVLGLQIGRDGEQFVELSTNKHLQISFRQNLKILAGLDQFILEILTFKELSDVPETGHTLALLRG